MLVSVRSDRYNRIPIEGNKGVTVKNIGTKTVFYSIEQGVSATVKDGELTEGGSVELKVPTYFIVEAPTRKGTDIQGVNESILQVTATGIQVDALPEGSLSTADLSATAGILGTQLSATAGIASGQITSLVSSKVTNSGSATTLPAAGAEKSVVVGTGGVARKITAVHVGDGVETKVKVKHAFNTFAVDVVVQKGAETKKPGANYLNAAGAGNVTWEPINAEEVEITFGTAPIAKFESFITIIG